MPRVRRNRRLLQADVARRLRDLDTAAIVTPPSLRLAGVRAGCGAVLLLATAVGAVPLLGPSVDAGRLAYFPGRFESTSCLATCESRLERRYG